MASSVRQRKHLLKVMHDDFKKYKLTEKTEFYKYLQIADKPLGMPVIRKHFKKWQMALRQLKTVYPDVFDHAAEKPKPVVKPASKKVDVKPTVKDAGDKNVD